MCASCVCCVRACVQYRRQLVDWIFEAGERFKLSNITCHVAVRVYVCVYSSFLSRVCACARSGGLHGPCTANGDGGEGPLTAGRPLLPHHCCKVRPSLTRPVCVSLPVPPTHSLSPLLASLAVVSFCLSFTLCLCVCVSLSHTLSPHTHTRCCQV